METSLTDLCSSFDTHAAHALIDRSTQLRCGIFSCMRNFLPFSQEGGNISYFLLLSWQCDRFGGDGGAFRSVERTFAL